MEAVLVTVVGYLFLVCGIATCLGVAILGVGYEKFSDSLREFVEDYLWERCTERSLQWVWWWLIGALTVAIIGLSLLHRAQSMA